MSAVSPRVSVIVPCFNMGATLDEAVQSVFDQTFQDFEIIVVDDGSTDPATRVLLEGYARPRTRVLREPHRGLPGTRNRALACATGEYVCALDADDRLGREYLAKTVSALDADPSLAFVSAWLETFGDEQWIWRQSRCDLATLLAECTVLTAALVRRDVLRSIGGYDEQMVEGDADTDLWIRVLEAGHRGTILPEVLFFYRRRPGSMSTRSQRGETRARIFRYQLEKHASSYRTHLMDVLLHKQSQIGDALRRNDVLERELDAQLEPEVERTRREVSRLRAKLDGVTALSESKDLRHELDRVQQVMKALHDSKSWRWTAPLRAAHRRLFGARGGA